MKKTLLIITMITISCILITPTTSTNTTNQLPELEIDYVKGGIGLQFRIKNLGDTPATNIKWDITFVNCTPIPRTRNGIIDSIQPSEEKTVKCIFLGLGKPKITINTTCDDAIPDEKIVSSHLTLIYFRMAFGGIADITLYENYEGVSPGYWKNHYQDPKNAWNATGYQPNATLETIFIPYYISYYDLDGDTLLDALNYGGGNGTIGAIQIFLRSAVAALLNAAHPLVRYPWEVSKVIQWVDECLYRGDREFMLSLKDTLDTWNNFGCEDKLY